VERALKLDFLEQALGGLPEGRALPTARELQDLLAETEIRLVTRHPHAATELLETAWYLHGVASVSARFDLYEPERQRRSFQVSAHIFDVALEDPRRRRYERLELGLAAQIGYQRGDLEPNAIAMYQRLRPLIEDGRLLDHIETLPLEVGIAVLGLNVASFSRGSERGRRSCAIFHDESNTRSTERCSVLQTRSFTEPTPSFGS
jgi:hypothetical protein